MLLLFPGQLKYYCCLKPLHLAKKNQDSDIEDTESYELTAMILKFLLLSRSAGITAVTFTCMQALLLESLVAT